MTNQTKTSAKKQSKYSFAHILKKSKATLGSIDNLTEEVTYSIVNKLARHAPKSEGACFLLASILSGRSIERLLSSNITHPVKKSNKEIDQGFYLSSSWQFPRLKIPTSKKELFQTPNCNGEIILPLELLSAFESMKNNHISHLSLCKDINNFICDELKNPFQTITPRRIEQCLSFYAPNFGLSRAEVAFVTDSPLNKHPHCSYGLFETSEILNKHQLYMNTILQNAEVNGFTTHIAGDERLFGSNFVLRRETVESLFKSCVDRINFNPCHTQQLMQRHNFYTLYVVMFLELCTLHRPILSPFGSLQNFDLYAGSVLIRDKGKTSIRVAPLPKIAVKVLLKYIEYLKQLLIDIQFDHAEIANRIAGTLAGSGNMFHLWDHKGITNFHQKKAHQLLSLDTPIPLNWARHYITTLLINSGISRNKIEVLLGHAPGIDSLYSAFSTVSFTSSYDLSVIIEKHITESLRIPLII